MENDVRTEGMYEYTVRFGEATIVRHLREYDFEKHDTVIPAYLGSYPVVEIGRAAFQEQYMIGSVTVPEGVRVIGEGAFADSNRITEFKLPRTLERIEGGAFSFLQCSRVDGCSPRSQLYRRTCILALRFYDKNMASRYRNRYRGLDF